jgi:hypothetical protein
MEGADARACAPAFVLASAAALRPSAGANGRTPVASCAGVSAPAQSPVSLRRALKSREAVAAGLASPRGPLKSHTPDPDAPVSFRPAPGVLVLCRYSIKTAFEVKGLCCLGFAIAPRPALERRGQAYNIRGNHPALFG